MELVQSFPAYFIAFAKGLLVSPDYIYVAVIALFFGLIAKKFAGALIIPILAAALLIAAQTIGPVVLDHKELVSPVFDLEFAKRAVASYLVFLVLSGIVLIVKKIVLKIVG